MSSMETYHGHVRCPLDAIILFEACRLGVLPRVQRRLSEKERMAIRSGSIFVWDEREAGMRRWTDGKSWSASRVSGSFLTYREMEGKRGGGTYGGPLIPSPPHNRSPSMQDEDEDSDRAGDGPDGYRYKPDGLMKQAFSIQTSSHLKLHLISYYSRSQSNTNELMQPSADPALSFIRIPKGMYPDATSSQTEPVPISHGQHPYQHPQSPQYIQHSQRAIYSQPYNQPEPPTQYPLQGYAYAAPVHQAQAHQSHQAHQAHQADAVQAHQAPPPAPLQQPVHMQVGQQIQPSVQNYSWPLSPSSTPPNYSLHSSAVPQHPQPRPYQPPAPTQPLQSAPPVQHQPAPPQLRAPIKQQIVPRPLQTGPPQTGLPSLQNLQQIPMQMQTGDKLYSSMRIGDVITRDLEVQDIPFDKVSWGEDTRAINQLNKGFSI